LALPPANGRLESLPHKRSEGLSRRQVILHAVRDAKLTARDRADLVEFLKALSGKYPIVEPPKLPE